jgi:hypothetical protein
VTARTAAARLTAGSAALAQHLTRRTVRWVAAGRRADLTGWRTALGPLVRGTIIAVVLYSAARIIRARPTLLWVVVPLWLIAAWRASPRPTAPQPAEKPAPTPRDGLARWLLDLIGDRPGVHLAELYPALRQLPGQQDRDDAALRAALRTLGVPVVRSLRIGGVAGRSGVRRTDVAAILSPAESRDGESHGDAGQTADSPRLSVIGEEVKST